MSTARHAMVTKTKRRRQFSAHTSVQGVPMLDTELRSLARGFRARAKEILLRAETMHDAEVRVKMCEIAAGYERLAQRVEQQDPRKAET
jgi:hypothetical protein